MPREERVRAKVTQLLTAGRNAAAFIRDEDGPTATEYAVMLALIILGAMTIIQSIGEGFRGIYLSIATKIPSA
jgi:pilus assembly protein Flp/PilA